MTTSTGLDGSTPKGLSSETSPPPSATAPPPSSLPSSPPPPVAQAPSATAPVPRPARDRKCRREAASLSRGVMSSGEVPIVGPLSSLKGRRRQPCEHARQQVLYATLRRPGRSHTASRPGRVTFPYRCESFCRDREPRPRTPSLRTLPHRSHRMHTQRSASSRPERLG